MSDGVAGVDRWRAARSRGNEGGMIGTSPRRGRLRHDGADRDRRGGATSPGGPGEGRHLQPGAGCHRDAPRGGLRRPASGAVAMDASASPRRVVAPGAGTGRSLAPSARRNPEASGSASRKPVLPARTGDAGRLQPRGPAPWAGMGSSARGRHGDDRPGGTGCPQPRRQGRARPILDGMAARARVDGTAIAIPILACAATARSS